MITGIIITVGILFVLFLIGASLYRIVPADESHVIIQGKSVRILSSLEGKSSYFKVPQWFFILNLGMRVHKIPLKQLSINVPNFLAFDEDRARFVCNIVAYIVVKDPLIAARRFSGDINYLREEVSKQVQAITRDATTKKPIREIIKDRRSIIDQINEPLQGVLETWGLDLKDIELIEFKDPVEGEDEKEPSHVISDISSIIEEQINSEARQKNAEQIKTARMKEAESDELAQTREIQRDEIVAKREQEKKKLVAEQEKLAREQELEVTKVEQVKNAEIAKEKAIVKANEEKATEEIHKERKRLEGEGDRLRLEELAKGNAASKREDGLAEAMALDAKQAALNKFKDEAIRALTAELIVNKDKEVGIATAKAFEKASVKAFVGNKDSEQGFNLASVIASVQHSDPLTAESILNKLARPNELVNMGSKTPDSKTQSVKKLVKD